MTDKNFEKIKEDRWNLYKELFEFIKNSLGLEIWGLSITGLRELDPRASIKDIDYSHFQAEIEFRNHIIYDKVVEDTFEELFGLFTHEVCHIFTSTGDTYFEENEHNIRLNYSQKEYALVLNSLRFCSEQMTNILDKSILKYLQTFKEYKEFEIRFNKLKTCNSI